MSTGQSVEANQAKLPKLNDLEGFDTEGEFAIVAVRGAGENNTNLVVSEAHVSRDRSMAYAAVRGLSCEYSFDMVNRHSKKLARSAGRPIDIAKEALSTAINHDVQVE